MKSRALIAAFAAGAALMLVVAALKFAPPTLWPAVDYWTERYQTLIGAVVALLAVLGAYTQLRMQLSHDAELARQADIAREQETTRNVISSLRQCVLDMDRVWRTAYTELDIIARDLSGYGAHLATRRDLLSVEVARPSWLGAALGNLPFNYAVMIGRYYDWLKLCLTAMAAAGVERRVIERYLVWCEVTLVLLKNLLEASEKAGCLTESPRPSLDMIAFCASHRVLDHEDLATLVIYGLVRPNDLPEVERLIATTRQKSAKSSSPQHKANSP